MSEKRTPADFPYDTHLDILKGPLETIDLDDVAKSVTRAPERTIILMVENAGIVPTGD